MVYQAKRKVTIYLCMLSLQIFEYDCCFFSENVTSKFCIMEILMPLAQAVLGVKKISLDFRTGHNLRADVSEPASKLTGDSSSLFRGKDSVLPNFLPPKYINIYSSSD